MTTTKTERCPRCESSNIDPMDSCAACVDCGKWFERELIPANHVDAYFGYCPHCDDDESTCCVNIGRCHWFICKTHKTRWCIGSNLFSSWQEETEEDWRRNHDIIKDFTEVEPQFCQCGGDHCAVFEPVDPQDSQVPVSATIGEPDEFDVPF